MSLVDTNTKKNSKRSKRKISKRPEWDSTINDHSEFKASPEEIARRQEVHRSKNLELVRKSAIEKRIAQARRQAVLADCTNKTGNAFLKEILYSSHDAAHLLDDTQKALQVAQDVFSEDAKKYKAVPTITTVENDENIPVTRSAPADGLIKTNLESQTKLEKLSESVMKKRALNETYSASSESDDDEIDCETPTNVFPPRLDLQRFQRLIDQEELSTINTENTASDSKYEDKHASMQSKNREKTIPKGGCSSNKTLRRAAKEYSVEDSQSLGSLIEQLEELLNSYEEQFFVNETGRKNTLYPDGTISSYTLKLVSCLKRMVSYFINIQDILADDRHRRLVQEKTIADLTNRTDLLTTELIQTQEQFNQVLDELNKTKSEHARQLDELKATVTRISKGQVVHTVTVDNPKLTTLANREALEKPIVHGKLASPVQVHEHEGFSKSIEQNKLNSTNNAWMSMASQDGLNQVYDNQKARGNLEEEVLIDGMTLEQRIRQLQDDHQETLEKFQKLGLEFKKGNITGAESGWVP